MTPLPVKVVFMVGFWVGCMGLGLISEQIPPLALGLTCLLYGFVYGYMHGKIFG